MLDAINRLTALMIVMICHESVDGSMANYCALKLFREQYPLKYFTFGSDLVLHLEQSYLSQKK